MWDGKFPENRSVSAYTVEKKKDLLSISMICLDCNTIFVYNKFEQEVSEGFQKNNI
jgi:hypothetical protein